MKDKIARFFDEFGMALRGLVLATREKSFWPPFVLIFVIFGTLLNLLSNGFSAFKIIWIFLSGGDFLGASKIIGNAFLGIFGIKKNFLDFGLNFLLTLLQSVLVALVVFVAKHNKKQDQGSAESSAIVAGLVVLGSGCPTCGTTLLAPVLGALLSGASSAVALAGRLSLFINLFAVILAVFVFKKLGLTTYAIIKSEQYLRRKSSETSN